jgi:hypothetical protein
MADGGDFDGVSVFQIEEHAIVAAAKAEADERGLQFFYITSAAGEVAIHAVENLQGRFAGGSVTSSRRTLAEFPRGECLHRGRAKHGRAPAPRLFQA